MTKWHISVGEKQYGPLDEATAKVYARENPGALCWRDGFSEWLPVAQVRELHHEANVDTASSAPASQSNDTIHRSSSEGYGAEGHTEGIDFKIHGHEMQFVEIELDPGESAIAEAGSMMYKSASVEMKTIFGDGSGQEKGSSFFGKLVGTGKRVLTGESLFMTVFTHEGSGKAHVSFAAPYPGHIVAIKLTDVGGKLICQKDSFLGAAKGVAVGLHFQRKILTALFGGEGFIMQKLEGDGWVFVHTGGTLMERALAASEVLHVDTGCLAALTESVNYEISRVRGIKSLFFGGEGLFFAKLTGPGHVWLQSLPFSRFAARLFSALPTQGKGKGEGSVLGGIGDLLDGDN